MLKEEEDEKWSGWLKPSCIPLTIILILILLVVVLPLLDNEKNDDDSSARLSDLTYLRKNCNSPCVFQLVESIPENLTYTKGSPLHPSIFEGWLDLIEKAEKSIDIASFYWTLRGDDVVPDPSAWEGERVFQELLHAGNTRNINIRIAQNKPSIYQPNKDTEYLARKGAATVRSVDFDRLIGAGVLHTKMWLIDNQHFYIGSANMDWRALTQVKELGAIMYNCSCLATDIAKIFEVYWMLGKKGAKIPPTWPISLQTDINAETPLGVTINNTLTDVYFSSSPPLFCPDGRTSDIDSILDVINKAEEYIFVAVMDYFPTTLYTKTKRYWPVIDDALRKAAVERRVHVRLLASWWNHTRPSMLYFIQSLAALNSNDFQIEVKLFIVPTYTEAQAKIPYARVNHNKYMVTDNSAYIGTSNWSEDYFINTGGIGFILNQSQNDTASSQPITDQLTAVFERDWFSEYAHSLSEFERYS
ncbi:phospholipase D3-like isoform X2 [Limulus polyphemus]|nr:phospholipase D3-like isoform X2 [Limulus polyphemus]XP_022252818.1 phospholipase D3-like isoform X2 [Limulus polyphemus]XP_022252819.1 phospholipase D3-like isoform X2 [Limulus polyphemus]XP_022252820.1 phospholipase D3-like isoform X2 [Limulus polyphemus]XP_022252821.1 phospholipase D3-like isoform X2 [Limulus polyphemus]XP_022252822.1 phospholipase D3-like isoform X2 [Limulus polyphemus]